MANTRRNWLDSYGTTVHNAPHSRYIDYLLPPPLLRTQCTAHTPIFASRPLLAEDNEPDNVFPAGTTDRAAHTAQRSEPTRGSAVRMRRAWVGSACTSARSAWQRAAGREDEARRGLVLGRQCTVDVRTSIVGKRSLFISLSCRRPKGRDPLSAFVGFRSRTYIGGRWEKTEVRRAALRPSISYRLPVSNTIVAGTERWDPM